MQQKECRQLKPIRQQYKITHTALLDFVWDNPGEPLYRKVKPGR